MLLKKTVGTYEHKGYEFEVSGLDGDYSYKVLVIDCDLPGKRGTGYNEKKDAITAASQFINYFADHNKFTVCQKIKFLPTENFKLAVRRYYDYDTPRFYGVGEKIINPSIPVTIYTEDNGKEYFAMTLIDVFQVAREYDVQPFAESEFTIE